LQAAREPRVTRGWLRFGGAILFVLLTAGCSSVATSGVPIQPATGQPASIANEAVRARLATALQPLHAASAFETIVAVDGATLVKAAGRSLGDASSLTVTTAGRSVQYIEIPPRAWAREGSGAWVLVAADQAPVAPLDVLADPLTLDAGAATSDGSTFLATYPAKALGLEGDPLAVTVTVRDDTVTFRYEATTAGRVTSSTTTIRPAPADRIAAPAP